MPDQSLGRAIAALRQLEDAVATTVEERPFGAVLRCTYAPTFALFNFVRVDTVDADVSATVAAARAAAEEHGLTTIVLDAPPSPTHNVLFETETAAGEWCRVPRNIYVCQIPPKEPTHLVERVTLDDYVEARRAFLNASGTYGTAQVDEEEEAARRIAAKVVTQHWGAHDADQLASIGEIYFIDGVAQLESLSTLPQSKRRGLGSAVTARRACAAYEQDVEIVFAQIQVGEEPSIRLHENLGFSRVGPRTTFEFGCPRNP